MYSDKVAILFYHGVTPYPKNEPNNSDGKHVELKKFEKQMRYISRKYNLVSLQVVVELLKGERRIPRNAVAVTFDDGYYNNLQFAYPIIKKYEIPITIFVTVNYVEKSDNHNFLGWSEIRLMHNEGVIFGAHTVTHPHLSMLSQQDIVNEVRDSKEIIESRLNDKIDYFSYPYGNFNETVKEAVKNNGYSCALATAYGVNDPFSDLYELKRIAVNNNFTFEYFVASLLPFLGNFISAFYSNRKDKK